MKHVNCVYIGRDYALALERVNEKGDLYRRTELTVLCQLDDGSIEEFRKYNVEVLDASEERTGKTLELFEEHINGTPETLEELINNSPRQRFTIT
ncbi:hypothetical protein FHL15_003235 [Xylaria flabelliformis]|uniref:Uncharacterized protein n=1 Tax=Xylaria flabelliformis TaxID=2512241 RepID=A0A553I647_9PEZI|nr:hypothetical protein FHL15_003235 [Xylaria flabelliformis]